MSRDVKRIGGSFFLSAPWWLGWVAKGIADSGCWNYEVGLTFQSCCLDAEPSARARGCWSEAFTPERCCGVEHGLPRPDLRPCVALRAVVPATCLHQTRVALLQGASDLCAIDFNSDIFKSQVRASDKPRVIRMINLNGSG